MELIYPCFKPICLFCTWMTIIWVILSDELKITTPQHVPLIIPYITWRVDNQKVTQHHFPWFQISPRKNSTSGTRFSHPFFSGHQKNTCWGALYPWILCVGEISMPSTCGTTKSLRFRAVHQGVNNVVMIRLSWLVDLNWVNNQPRKEDKEHGVVIVLKQHVKGEVGCSSSFEIISKTSPKTNVGVWILTLSLNRF